MRRISPNRKAPGVGLYTRKLSNYKCSARSRGLVFDLTREEFIAIISQPCRYCAGEPIPYSVEGKYFGTIYVTGIDRKDFNLGYIHQNCVPCCATCNYAKSNLSEEAFVAWVRRVASNLEKTA